MTADQETGTLRSHMACPRPQGWDLSLGRLQTKVQVLYTTLPPSGVWAILTSGLEVTTLGEEGSEEPVSAWGGDVIRWDKVEEDEIKFMKL